MKKLFIISVVLLGLTVAQSFSQCSVSVQITNAKCANSCDGIIAVIPTGTPPFTYSWSPFMGQTTQTVTGLCPNSWPDYTVTVTDSIGCVATATATITSPPSIYVTQTSAFSCTANTGTASVTPSGGVPPYTYNWSPSGQTTQIATGLGIGNYQVTVMDNNSCSYNFYVAISPIEAKCKITHTNAACNGTSWFFTDQSTGNPVQWYWDFGDGNFSTTNNPWHAYTTVGSYTVTLVVTNGFGCSDTIQKTIYVNPIPYANFSSTTVCLGSPTCFTDLSTISSGAITSWSWNFYDPSSGNNYSILQNPCHIYSSGGIVGALLWATSDSGCTAGLFCGCVFVDSCLGVQDIYESALINIFPNPFCTQTTLQTANPVHNATLTIYNSFGQTVKQFVIRNSSSFVISRDNLPSGLYLLLLTEENKIIAVDKLVIADN